MTEPVGQMSKPRTRAREEGNTETRGVKDQVGETKRRTKEGQTMGEKEGRKRQKARRDIAYEAMRAREVPLDSVFWLVVEEEDDVCWEGRVLLLVEERRRPEK